MATASFSSVPVYSGVAHAGDISSGLPLRWTARRASEGSGPAVFARALGTATRPTPERFCLPGGATVADETKETLTMRSNSKIVLAALLGMLLCSALASASASASACTKKEGSKIYQLCIGGSAPAATETVEFETRGTAPLVLEGVEVSEISLACETVTQPAGELSSFLLKPEQSLAITFKNYVKGCALTAPHAVVKSCLMTSQKAFRRQSGTMASQEGVVVSAEGGGEFWSWLLSNNGAETCTKTFAGGWDAGGTYECTLHEAKVEAVEHELVCTSSKSHKVWLSFNPSEAVPFRYSQMISLAGAKKGSKFSVYEAK